MTTPPDPGDWGALRSLAFKVRNYLLGWLPDRETMRAFGRRFITVVIAIFIVGIAGFALAFWKHKTLFDWLLVPAGDRLSPFDGDPVFTNPTDPLLTTINIAVIAGFLCAVPVFAFGLIYIFHPVISRRYQRLLVTFLLAALGVFIGGAAFAYYVLLEVSLGFLLGFGEGVAVPLIALGEYIALIVALMIWMGIIFQIPLVMYLLPKMHIIGYQKMKKLTPVTIVSMMILAGIITPTTDPWTWGFVAGPMILLYQVGLFLAWTVEPEEGNYLFIGSLWSMLTWPYRRARRAF